MPVEPAPVAPLGIIAASGTMPVQIARAAAAQGRRVHIAGLSGLHAPEISEFSHITMKWGQVGRMFAFMRDNGVREIVFIGAVDRRPDLNALGVDATGMRLLPRILKGISRGGDDAVLRTLVGMVEDGGFTVIGAHEVDPSLTAASGIIVGPVPDGLEEDGAVAMRAAEALGALDIGQGAIAVEARVVAVEAAEGTDQMIGRVKTLRESGRVRWSGRRGVLAKRAKPDQDLRVDMPVIGPRTVAAVADAGLAGIVIEAGRVMIADREETLRLARETRTAVVAVATAGMREEGASP